MLSYEGRIGIKKFWMGLLRGMATTICLAMTVGVLMGIGFAAFDISPARQEQTILGASVLIAIYMVANLLAVTVKRCHDCGRSGWWCLLTLVPFVGLAWVIFDLGMTRGKPET